MAVRPRRISDIKPILTNLAQTSHYEVRFGSMPSQLGDYLSKKGINSRFIAEDFGLLCYNALLPTTSLMTSNISGNFTGITENFAHTRQYDSISLDFYVDKNYQTLKFIESWMEFIASGSTNPIDPVTPAISSSVGNYFTRMQYPEYYKANSVKIVKFDRDYRKEIEYNFRGLFPSSISSLQVGYSQSDTLKMSATFVYDRYIAGKADSLDVVQREDNNKEPNQKSAQDTESTQSTEDLYKQTLESFKFSVDNSKNSNSIADSLTKTPFTVSERRVV